MVAPEPSKEKHYASYPSGLVRIPIKAGTSQKGACAECGAPWRRVTERAKVDERDKEHGRYAPLKGSGNHATAGVDGNGKRYDTNYRLQTQTVGWEPTCTHGADVVPCRVLDPFGGSGTSALVADQLGRDATIIELQSDYTSMAERRIRNDAPLFVEVSVEPNGGLQQAPLPLEWASV
jgi:hypothetical protein